ncbi:hypothetical protein BGZ91_005758, partial [Linnemannia elongata]
YSSSNNTNSSSRVLAINRQWHQVRLWGSNRIQAKVLPEMDHRLQEGSRAVGRDSNSSFNIRSNSSNSLRSLKISSSPGSEEVQEAEAEEVEG